MRLSATLIAALLLCATIAQAQKKTAQPALQRTLDSLYTIENPVQQQWADARSDSARTQAERMRAAMQERHQRQLLALTDQYGFPTYAMVGEVTSRRFGALVLRYDRLPAFQQQVQQLMAQETKKKSMDDVFFATLTDIVELRAGRPQVYGTQLAYQSDSDKMVVQEPLLEPEKVNKRRKELGLEPLEDYLNKHKEKHQPKTKRAEKGK